MTIYADTDGASIGNLSKNGFCMQVMDDEGKITFSDHADTGSAAKSDMRITVKQIDWQTPASTNKEVCNF